MSILDATLARNSGTADTVAAISKAAGLSPAQTEKALMVLARCHVGAGDTLANAARLTGHDTKTLENMIEAIGGDNGLQSLADTLSTGLGDLGRGNFFKDLFAFG